MNNLGKGSSNATKTSDTIPTNVLATLSEPGGFQYDAREKVSLPLMKKGLIVGSLLVNNSDFVSEVGDNDVSLVLKQPGWAKPRLACFSYEGFIQWMAIHKLESVHDEGFLAAATKLVSPD